MAHDIERLSKLITNIAREMLGKNAKNATKRDVLNAWNEIAKIRLYKKFGQIIAFDDAEALIKADQALKIRRESADGGILPEKIEESEFEALGLEKRIGNLALKKDASDYERQKRLEHDRATGIGTKSGDAEAEADSDSAKRKKKQPERPIGEEDAKKLQETAMKIADEIVQVVFVNKFFKKCLQVLEIVPK